MMAADPQIRFRPLGHGDLALLQRWLNDDFVARWWPGWPSLEQVRARYAPRIDGRDPTKCFIIELDSTPVGFIQHYCVSDDPNLRPLIEEPERARGIDLFLGDRAYAYRGLGPHIIGRFLREVVFEPPTIALCMIDPAQNNLAAIQAYKKVGFHYLATIHDPRELQPSYVMILRREEFSDE
jgi:RimJ/RimL family protein N-acetyltransferase